MPLSPTGVLMIAINVVASFSIYFWLAGYPALLVTGVRYVLGDAAARVPLRILDRVWDALGFSWVHFISGLFELLLGVRIAYTFVDEAGEHHARRYMTGGLPDLSKILRAPRQRGKVKIIIVNHHSRVDWLFLMPFLARSSLLLRMRFVLKDILRKVPIIGWGMESMRYLFLSRSWETDEDYLEQMLRYMMKSGESQTVLIFPEGTDLSASNRARSQAYAQRTGMPIFHHVLNPRTTGLVALIRMFGAGNVEEVIDLTLGYTYYAPGERPAEMCLVNGRCPRKVHLLIHLYRFGTVMDQAGANSLESVSVAPRAEEAFATWVHERFMEKEQLLSRFYRTSPVGFDETDVRTLLGPAYGVASYDEDVEAQKPGLRSFKLMRYMTEVGLPAVLMLLCIAIPCYMAMHSPRWMALHYIVATVVVACLLSRYGSFQKWLYLKRARAIATACSSAGGASDKTKIT